MTDNNNAWNDLLRDRRLVLGASLVAASAAGFTGGCLLARPFTDTATIQLSVGLLGAVIFPALKWKLIPTDDSAAEELPLSNLWSGILLTYGLGIILFPSVCPAPAHLLQDFIPAFFYYAVGISGAIAVCVFIGMMWLKILKPLAKAENQLDDGD